MPNLPWPKPYLVFHLWAGGTAAKHKEWPVDRWVKLVEHFAEREYQMVLTGGPSQRAANERVIDAVNPSQRSSVHNGAGLSLTETSAVIAGSALVVSVDTGVMHLAAALDACLIALMGPASSRRWGPISTRAVVIDSPLHGCGYLNLGFEIPAVPPKCMEAIRFDTVRAACEGALLPDKVRPVRPAEAGIGDRNSI